MDTLSVGFDAEKIKYPNTGLNSFCYHLALALQEEALKTRKACFKVFLPKVAKGYFNGRILEHIYRLYEKRFLVVPNLKVWHQPFQSGKYFPKGNHSTLLTIHDLNYLYEKGGKHRSREEKIVQRNIDRSDKAYYFNYDFDPDLMLNEFESGMNDFMVNGNAQKIKEHSLFFSWEKAAKSYWSIYNELGMITSLYNLINLLSDIYNKVRLTLTTGVNARTAFQNEPKDKPSTALDEPANREREQPGSLRKENETHGNIKVTLLVSTYNWPQALALCLNAALLQTRLPDEIVIADDGSKDETRKTIEQFRQRTDIPIVHCWQEDKGFRKTRILNLAIAQSTGEYIIQIDGDIVMDRRFIADHLSQVQPHTFLRGSRAGVSEAFTQEVLSSGKIDFSAFSQHLQNRFNAFRSRLLAMLLCRKSDDVRHVKGCNTSFWKEDFIAVNGYNNDLSGWGHEDIELAARLYNNGTTLRIIKALAVGYHLHHPLYSRADEGTNLTVYNQVMEQHIKRCQNGYNECLHNNDENDKVWR